jgi:hypothetical protein
MIRIGLSSSALLTLSAHDLIAAAVGAGVDAIEWAGDFHVQQGDAAAVSGLMMETLRAGLTTASYAPLYRALPGGELGLRFESVLETALRLQAPIVRIFLGGVSSVCREGEGRARLAAEARRAGRQSRPAGRDRLPVAGTEHLHGPLQVRDRTRCGDRPSLRPPGLGSPAGRRLGGVLLGARGGWRFRGDAPRAQDRP